MLLIGALLVGDEIFAVIPYNRYWTTNKPLILRISLCVHVFTFYEGKVAAVNV